LAVGAYVRTQQVGVCSGCDADFGADLGCSSKYVVFCSELGIIAFLRMGVVIDNYRKLHIIICWARYKI